MLHNSKRIPKSVRKSANSKLKEWIWGGILSLLDEMYLILSICVFVNFRMYEKSSDQNFNEAIGFFILGCLIALPVYILIAGYRNYKFLFIEKHPFQDTYAGGVITAYRLRLPKKILLLAVLNPYVYRLTIAACLVWMDE